MYEALKMDNLYLESVFMIYSRQLKIVGFADEFTRNKFQKQTQR